MEVAAAAAEGCRFQAQGATTSRFVHYVPEVAFAVISAMPLLHDVVHNFGNSRTKYDD